jgi:molybdopterin converting factor subunit 1
MNRTVSVLYFAWLRERVGTDHEKIDLPDTVGSVAALVDHLAARSERHATAFANRRTIRCAVDQEFADPDAPLRGGEEVAFFPPVTGG